MEKQKKNTFDPYGEVPNNNFSGQTVRVSHQNVSFSGYSQNSGLEQDAAFLRDEYHERKTLTRASRGDLLIDVNNRI